MKVWLKFKSMFEANFDFWPFSRCTVALPEGGAPGWFLAGRARLGFRFDRLGHA